MHCENWKSGTTKKAIQHVSTDPKKEDVIREHQEANLTENLDPTNASEWKDAVLDGYAAHIKNRTCEIVDYPKHRKPIRNGFVPKTKIKANGKIERRKTRPGADFQETYVPVVRAGSIRMLIALSAE